VGRDGEKSEVGRGVSDDEVENFAVGADVEGADENVGAGFDEPALEVTPDGWGDIVGDEDGHGFSL
jgi:hypothetical protein